MPYAQAVHNTTMIATIKTDIKQTEKLLSFVRKNAQMGTTTLERLAEILGAADRGMTDIVSRQLNEYRHIADAAGTRARALGSEPEDVGGIARAAATAILGLQSIADKSASHIAEMIVIGSARGVISALRQIRLNPNADSDAINLAYRLLCTERMNIDRLLCYV